MLGALTSLTGGGGLSGGAATNGDQKTQSSFGVGDTGNIHNGGLTLNSGFKFDDKNPLHIGGLLLIAGVVAAYFFKRLKK